MPNTYDNDIPVAALDMSAEEEMRDALERYRVAIDQTQKNLTAIREYIFGPVAD